MACEAILHSRINRCCRCLLVVGIQVHQVQDLLKLQLDARSKKVPIPDGDIPFPLGLQSRFWHLYRHPSFLLLSRIWLHTSPQTLQGLSVANGCCNHAMVSSAVDVALCISLKFKLDTLGKRAALATYYMQILYPRALGLYTFISEPVPFALVCICYVLFC